MHAVAASADGPKAHPDSFAALAALPRRKAAVEAVYFSRPPDGSRRFAAVRQLDWQCWHAHRVLLAAQAVLRREPIPDLAEVRSGLPQRLFEPPVERMRRPAAAQQSRRLARCD